MIKFYNRKSKKYEIELVAGEKYLNWTYSSRLGMGLLEIFIKKKAFSKLYGWYCDKKISKPKIKAFIKDLNIDMSITEKTEDEFNSFNDFFVRRLKSHARPFSDEKNILISPADGRLFAYEHIDLNNIMQIKGINYSLLELIKDKAIASKYIDGTCLVFRLCPTDYHRFHFIDDGVCEKSNKINGSYYSVNPIALKTIPKVFCENKREWSIFHSENFKDVLYVEVGATCVGSILQTYTPNSELKKGDEKGYFKFGGSTVVLFLEKNVIKIDSDIIEQTKFGYETKIFMGEKIGSK
ncbi:phosphatidylserine decarboxylase [Clostridium guangxiense]|uniref:phosphatidylserine decarboxylase n=1 Tax=Clostridium guangxiense TaxID=1662055 RepID=UPI001E578068|nr:phosphatidylserine decarboxylase [Clostridium guangxiense]MCD2346733.1 phosphatidylserine decarboxylase [Clostridium guangxiense]